MRRLSLIKKHLRRLRHRLAVWSQEPSDFSLLFGCIIYTRNGLAYHIIVLVTFIPFSQRCFYYIPLIVLLVLIVCPCLRGSDLSRRSVTPRDLSNTGSPAGFPKTRANKPGGMLRIKSAMLSLCLCECGPHSPIATRLTLITIFYTPSYSCIALHFQFAMTLKYVS